MVSEAVRLQEQLALEAVPHDCKAVQQQHEDEQAVLCFNWDQRQTAKAAMQTLVQAMAEDPINSYFSGKKRMRFVKDEVKGYLKALPDATNFLATQDSKAVALWQLMPQETPRNELFAGWTRIFKVPPKKWRQLLRLEMHYEKAHAEVAGDFGSYYYLSFIGTAPEARGKGYGSLLLRCITDRADKEGRWCLLEATSDRSEALYARHGFVTYETYRAGPKVPPVFLMKRAPASPAVKSPVALSAAALDLITAVSNKTAGPGSECESTTSSSPLIAAAVVIDDAESCKAQSHAACGATSIACLDALEACAAASVSVAGSNHSSGSGKCDESNQQLLLSSSSAGAGGPTAVSC